MQKASKKLLSFLALATLVVPAASWANNPRNPQVVLNGATLQAYFNSVGQTINVNTDQFDIPCWSTTVSGNSTFTIQLELAGNAGGNAVGLYNCSAGVPTLFQVFPGAASPGWFAVAHFQGGNLVVTLFDNNAIIQGQNFYAGVDAQNFGFYLQGPNGTFYTQDARNGGAPQALVYAGTGTETGQWWLAFEDVPYNAGDDDFDDFVMFMESVNKPLPTVPATWGDIKTRFDQ